MQTLIQDAQPWAEFDGCHCFDSVNVVFQRASQLRHDVFEFFRIRELDGIGNQSVDVTNAVRFFLSYLISCTHNKAPLSQSDKLNGTTPNCDTDNAVGECHRTYRSYPVVECMLHTLAARISGRTTTYRSGTLHASHTCML